MADMNEVAKKLLESDEGKKLAGKKNELEKIASGRDGKKVMELLNEGNIESAIKSGDTESIKSALQNAMKTDAGARFMREISRLMGK